MVHNALHLFHFLGRGGSINVAHDAHSHLAAADIGRDIGGNPLPLDPSKIFAERRPVSHNAERLKAPVEPRRGGAKNRPGRIGFAEDLRRDALPDLALAVPVREQGEVGMAVEVDKARTDHQPRGVNCPPGGHVDEPADVRDPAVFDSDGPGEPGTASAVNDVPACDQQVVCRLFCGARTGKPDG